MAAGQVTPLKPIAPATRALLGVLFFILFVAVWAAATFGGLVSKVFLADPLTMVAKASTCSPRRASSRTSGSRSGASSAASCWLRCSRCRSASRWERIGPIGAFFEPFVSFARYLPASAFIPLPDPVGRESASCRSCW
jgi:NitT/TauT family transport system permease protein